MYKTISKCRIDGNDITELWDLGELYLSHFYDKIDHKAPKAPLNVVIGKQSNLLQLKHTVNRDDMYRQYWYLSGTNDTMTGQLRDVVNSVSNWVDFKDKDIVLDIGCNDGTLLDLYSKNVKLEKVGIDPAKNLSHIIKSKTDKYLCDYFDFEKFNNLVDGRKAKVITSIAMYYDLDDPSKFAKDVYDSLVDDGIWVLQLSYTPLMLIQNAFDNIIHEHLEYYTYKSIKYILEKNNFKLLDVELNNTNAGSIRIVASKNKNNLEKIPIFNLDIGNLRMESLEAFENNKFPNIKESFLNLKNRINVIKDKTLTLLSDLKKKNKLVVGYGASTKGNTLLQYYGIDDSLINFICERQSQKFGKLTPGSWIKIISDEEMRKIRPDYLFVLPWHFTSEFLQREKELLKNGTKFILPLPELKVIGE